MYTFNPIPTVPVDHIGLFIVGMVCTTWMVVCLMNCADEFFATFFFVSIIMAISYGVSYHWTNQEPKTFANVKVTAQFVGYQPEGYREKSGKSYVDKHFVYVVYSVNGNHVLLQGQSGVEYPKTAILYKN